MVTGCSLRFLKHSGFKERNKKHQPTLLFSQGQHPSSMEAVLETHKLHSPAFDNFPVSSRSLPSEHTPLSAHFAEGWSPALLSFLFSSLLTSAQDGNSLSHFFLFFSFLLLAFLLCCSLSPSLPPSQKLYFVCFFPDYLVSSSLT